jgi:hypothetical protein
MASASHSDNQQRGNVKDPEHDGRLKENREAGRTKGTTSGSQARAEEHGREPAGSSRGSGSHSSSSHGKSQDASHRCGGDGDRGPSGRASGGSDDLKSREYKDEHGEVHHHTRTYMEQHEGKQSSR